VVWQSPTGPDEVAGIAVRVLLQVVLVLRFGLPERTRRLDLGEGFAGPETGGIDIGDRVDGDTPLLVATVVVSGRRRTWRR